LAVNALIEGAASAASGKAAESGCYQICGPNAFNRYRFDEQVPARTYLYNNRFSGDRQIGSVCLSLTKVAESHLGSTEEVTTPVVCAESTLPACGR